jgi:hypothetical protein
MQWQFTNIEPFKPLEGEKKENALPKNQQITEP